MSHPASIEVHGLRVGYPTRRTWALDGVDLRIRPGEQVLVVGASGSGKSSLLHAISGLLPRAIDADLEGSVRVGGREILGAELASLFGTVGLLRQDPLSQVAMPLVEDELAFVLESRATAPGRISDLVDAALDRVGLPHLRSRRTATLSGGELQRVALAATLLAQPDVLVLDEPTAMLDPAAAQEVGRLVHELGGTATTVVVEHRLEALARLPERVVLVDDGQIRRSGSTPEVLASEAEWLAASGSWLPPAVELALAGGRRPDPDAVERGGLGDAATASDLRQLARRSRPAPTRTGDVVLRARGATFGPPAGPPLVHDLDLHLVSGEVTAVIGANGSGKTSLLSGLAGQLPLHRGDLQGSPAGLVFQHPEHQFIGRTVAADIAAGLRSRGEGAQDLAVRVAETLARFALDDVADGDPFRLSGGQKRRLSVASMSVLDHRVLCLDEPTFSLDRRSSLQVAATITSLAAEGRAVVFSSHDLRLAATVADRVLVVRDGRVVADGRPDDVMRDLTALASAGLRRPLLLDRWADVAPEVPLRDLLGGLEAAVASARGQAVS